MVKRKIHYKSTFKSGGVKTGKFRTVGGLTSSDISPQRRQGNISAVTRNIISGLPNAVLKGIVVDIFPDMEEKMKDNIKDWSNHGLYKYSGSDSVYNTFRYSKGKNFQGNRKSISFSNYSTHVLPLIEGVTPRPGAWYVGDWVEQMAKKGLLKNKKSLKRKNGSYPMFIMGIGETTRREDKSLKKKLTKAQQDITRLKNKPRYSGRTKDIKKAVRKESRINKQNVKRNLIIRDKRTGAVKSVGQRKFTNLLKGKSRRDFWSPVVQEYFGYKPRGGSSEPTGGKQNQAVKIISDRLYKEIKKNIGKRK